MIASQELARWLADPEAQARSHQAIQDTARRWARHPLMTDLKRELDGLADPAPEAVLAAAQRFMDRTGDIDALIGDLIAGGRADPFYSPPFHSLSGEIHNALLLFASDELLIALGVTGVEMLAAKKAGKRGATSIGFNGQLTAFRYLKAGNAVMSFWEAPPIGEDFAGARAGQPRLVERRRIRDGEEVVIDGRHQSFVIEHADSDMLYFQALVRVGPAPVAIEYDSKTMEFVSASSADESASRVQMMASLLRAMERDDAMPVLEQALDSPHFHTRWHVMREMLALDAEAARPALERMAASDPHDEVRAAARQTLDMFFADATAEGAEPCRA
jgi:hypothetical protein